MVDDQVFTRLCPGCGKELFYKSQLSLDNCISKNTSCLKCGRKKQVCSEETRIKRSKNMTGKKFGPRSEAAKARMALAGLKRHNKRIDPKLEEIVASGKGLDQLAFSRLCPNCDNEITYSNRDHYNSAEEQKSLCRSCTHTGRKLSIEARQNMSLAAYQRYGTTPERLQYSESQLTTWGRHVKKADLHKCIICGSSKELQAHHLLARSKHPEFALSEWNGVTLCKSCHDIEHDLNGLI